MRQAAVWFLLNCKRYLRKWSFALILLALPAAAWALRQVEEKEGQEVRIAVYAEEGRDREKDLKKQQGNGAEPEKPLEAVLAENLEAGSAAGGRLFRFYQCNSAQQVRDEVASRRAECGYVIPAGLREKLDQEDYRHCIQVYSAPSTVLASLSSEIVFAALMRSYGKEIFLDYIGESETVRQNLSGRAPEDLQDAAAVLMDQVLVQAAALYDKWQNNGSTFRFEYGYRSSGQQESESEPAPAVFPVRGIAAVYLFLTGLYSGVMLGSDEEKGLFLPLPPGRRIRCSLAALAAPVFLAAVSAMAALKAGGCLENPGREAAVLAVYCLAVCIFAYGAKAVCRKPQILCCMIPFFLVGSLVFAPVIVDIRQFFPAMGWVEKLFLPSWYLRAF